MKNIFSKIVVTGLLISMLLIGLPFSAKAARAGSLDSSFGSNGVVITSVGSSDSARDSVIQADGKIVVAGQSNTGAGGAAVDFAVVRYNADGSLDTTFDTDGKVTTDFGGSDSPSAVAVQADGKIIVVGATDISGIISDFAIARYNANGSLDTTFDGDGKVTTDFAAFDDEAIGVAVQPDGKIVVVGFASPASGNRDYAFARYNTNGTPDTTFDTDGKFTFGSTNNFGTNGDVPVGTAAIP